MSAHRTPDVVDEYVTSAPSRGTQVLDLCGGHGGTLGWRKSLAAPSCRLSECPWGIDDGDVMLVGDCTDAARRSSCDRGDWSRWGQECGLVGCPDFGIVGFGFAKSIACSGRWHGRQSEKGRCGAGSGAAGPHRSTRGTTLQKVVVLQPKGGFRYSMDPILLAGWALEGGVAKTFLVAGRVLIISLLLANRGLNGEGGRCCSQLGVIGSTVGEGKRFGLRFSPARCSVYGERMCRLGVV